MRWHDAGVLLALCSPLLAGCASSSLDMAPERSDRPWAPTTTAAGEIVAGAPASPAPATSGYVLPANPALRTIPSPPKFDAAHAYSLPELIDIAQSDNPETRVSWDEARDAALAAGIAKATYLPNITGSIIGGYQSTHGTQTFGGNSASANGDIEGSISAVSLQWLLFDFGQRDAVVEAAEQTSAISNIAFTAAHQEIIYKVALAFYADAAARAHVASAAEALRNAEDVEAAADDRYRRGIGTVVEVAQAKQGTAQERLAQVEATGAAQDARLALLAAMGISPFTQIKVADTSGRTLSLAMKEPIEQMVAQALSQRPDMLSANAAHQASLANLRAAEAEFLPKLFLSATGSYVSGGLSVTALPSVGQGSPTLNLSGQHFGTTFLMGVAVPIYDGGTREALLLQARSNEDKATATLAKVRDDAVQQIVSAGNTAQTSLSAYAASQALAAAAQTTYDATLAAYRRGVGSVTDMTTAETQLLTAKNTSTDAYNASLSAAATLALSLGTLGKAPDPY